MDKVADRRLAAILVTDLVGYSRLLGADETGTLRRMKELRREVIEPRVTAAHGRIVKSTGDGLIIEFPSPLRAVLCAVAVQHAMLVRDDSVVPDQALRLRIGINVGDVVAEPDGDIYGDGVNVAARLEPLAEPGGLCISRSVYEQIRDRLPYPFEDRGEQELKNIARPVGIYALGPAVIAGLNPEEDALDVRPFARKGWRARAMATCAAALFAASGLGWWLWRAESASVPAQTLAAQMIGEARPAPRLSLVVLPFANLSSDPEQEFFADGLTEDLTTDLSHLDGSFVIARNTAFTYKGKPVEVKQLGRDLGVRYVLEGSVRRTGEQVAVNAQLIAAETGAHVWADRFQGDRSRLGELQADFVARLARSLDVQLTQAESLRSLRERPSNPDAADLEMRGWAAINRPRSLANLNEALGYFEQALAIDPNAFKAQLGFARATMLKVTGGVSIDAPGDTTRADAVISRILAANPDHALAHQIKGDVYRARKQFSSAIVETDIATSLDKNLVIAYHSGGVHRMFNGKAAESFEFIENAIRLSPKDPLLNYYEYNMCHSHTHLGHWEKAIEWCRRSVSHGPFWLAYIDLVAAYAWTGQDEEAHQAMAELLKLKPGYTVQKWANAGWSDNPTFLAEYQRIVEGLRKAGLPET